MLSLRRWVAVTSTLSILSIVAGCTATPETNLGGKRKIDKGATQNEEEEQSDSSKKSDDGNGSGEKSEESGGESTTPRSAACVARDAKLQAALDGVRKSPNTILSIHDEACGTSVYVSGDAKNASKTSLWRIGSITKTFTAAAVLSLVAENKLSLSDPLEKFVPNVAPNVTVRMLLNHTSGIWNYTETNQFNPTTTYSPEDLVQISADNGLYFAAGQGFHYSNTNYVLLGMIAEIVGNAKVSAVIRTRAITKAKLKTTFFAGEEPLVGTLTRGFAADGQDVTTFPNMTGPWAAGAIVATGADLADWIHELYGTNDVLGEAMRQEMVKGSTNEPGYALGAQIMAASETFGGGVGFGHDGEITGFRSTGFYYPERKTAIGVVVNSVAENVSPFEVNEAALKALFSP